MRWPSADHTFTFLAVLFVSVPWILIIVSTR
jgi:hypothetical protein